MIVLLPKHEHLQKDVGAVAIVSDYVSWIWSCKAG